METKKLTSEQIARIKACKSGEELTAVAAECGIEMTDEQLELLSGGAAWDSDDDNAAPMVRVSCMTCGYSFSYLASNGRPTYCPSCGGTNLYFFS